MTQAPESEFFTENGKAVANRIYVEKEWGSKFSIERLCNELGELRARVEALEREAAMTELRAEARPAPSSSLVERVVPAIHHSIDLDLEARAAIRAVAAWMRDLGGNHWAGVAQRLELEANR